MSHFSPSLKHKIENDPERERKVIVRVNGDMDVCEGKLKASGFHIRRKLMLIKGFAITAPGSSVQELAHEDWITHVEEDSQVHTA